MATKPIIRNDYTSTTDPSDPDAIPAFETALGLKGKSAAGRQRKPTFVNKNALSNFNSSVDPAVLKNQVAAANVAALYSKNSLRPDEIAALRRRAFEIVATEMESAASVMAGSKVWNPTQFRLFGLLVDRVLPKMSTISLEDNSAKKLDDMSIEELEAIALGKRKHEAVDAVVKIGAEIGDAEDKKANASADRKLNKIVREAASTDVAEKAYMAKKQEKPAPKK
jgi:hypothetical protein